MEPKERITQLVESEGKDILGDDRLQFRVVNIGETVEGAQLN